MHSLLSLVILAVWSLSLISCADSGSNPAPGPSSASTDQVAPTVSLTAPMGGGTVSNVITLSSTASDNVGVMGVQFRMDGTNVGAEDPSAPYSMSWNTTAVANGAHTVTAVARDAAGNSTVSLGIAVTVSNAAPPAGTLIDTSRSVDWSQAGVVGGIPSRTTNCATFNPGATAAQINVAIQSCPSGQVVFLNTGTYNLSSGIDFNSKSHVTLRGAGADQTKIVFGAGAATGCRGAWANVCIDSGDTNWGGGPSNLANWTAGYARGTTVITLSNRTNLSVGDPLILDQLNDDANGSPDTGSIYVCTKVSANCNDDGPNGGPGGAARPGRDQAQFVTVTAINGSQVTITPGHYMPNWRANQSPGAWWATNPVFMNGVEDLSIDHSASDEKSGLAIFNCSGCWVKGIRSINSNRNHVWMYYSSRIVVRDSYFYGTKNAVSQSYGVECYPSSDSVIENNIFQHITAPQMLAGACSGSVIGYNYSIDDYYQQSPLWMMHSVWLHAGGIDHVLLEGNVGAGLASDLFHGSHHFVTAFRNRWNGLEATKTDNTLPIRMWPFSRYYNVIGNVLGDAAKPHTNYQVAPSIGGNASLSIYELGIGTVNISVTDPATVNTLFRWGNYDTATGTARFLAAEVPFGLGQYANPVPANNTLSASLYLSTPPVWWSPSIPWPAIGPDVTGGNIPGVAGHAFMIPAQVCFNNATTDAAYGSANIKIFNANSCY